jgi:hypothetical protein
MSWGGKGGDPMMAATPSDPWNAGQRLRKEFSSPFNRKLGSALSPLPEDPGAEFSSRKGSKSVRTLAVNKLHISADEEPSKQGLTLGGGPLPLSETSGRAWQVPENRGKLKS